MPNIVVVGAQWGDEAKGKVVDYLAGRADMVVRYGGGANAGHTVTVGGEVYKFHLIPSGILHEDVTCVIAAGVVIDPAVLVREVQELGARGCPISNLRISGAAHVIMPYHPLLDQLEEQRRGTRAIGTTAKGIGPAYADKASRCGVRMGDLVDDDRREKVLRQAISAKNDVLVRLYGADPLDADAIVTEYAEYADALSGFVCETASLVAECARNGRGVIFEGAQGTLLDLDVGTYPYVTSSHPLAGGACIGTGVGPTAIHGVVGAAKAYTTRVGAGVFPTELNNSIGDHIRERGKEYGTTTGRPRRCGWLDGLILRYAALHNGLRCLLLGHLDVLTGLDEVKIATAYRTGPLVTESLPSDLAFREDIEPVYEVMSGWTEDITDVRSYDALPEACRAYVSRVEQIAGVPVWAVSVGPGREHIVPLAGRSPA
jgi:adenylosuccinate synthase